MQIADKVFVVTGGGNGIGREVVLELIRRRGRVAAVDLRADGLAETVRLAGAPEGRLTTHTLSVADRAAVQALPDQVIAAHGQVDGVLNIAGIIQRFVHVEELSIEEIERVMAVNFWGTLYMDKTFIPVLKQRPQAALLNVSSMGGLVPVPGQGAYGASKGAVKLLTETLYAELRDTHVAVTVVFPGGVGTNITGNSGVDVPAAALEGLSRRRSRHPTMRHDRSSTLSRTEPSGCSSAATRGCSTGCPACPRRGLSRPSPTR